MARIDVEQRIQDAIEKKRQADNLLKQLRGRQSEIERKKRQRKIWLIGEAVLNAMENNSELNRQILDLIEAAALSDRDRALLGLALPSGSKESNNENHGAEKHSAGKDVEL